VSVPLVIGMTADGAAARLAEQPLGTKLAYAPAKPGTLPGVVVGQDPREGGLSANDTVTIWISKARDGVLPNFVGSSLDDAEGEAARLKLRANVVTVAGRAHTVLEQFPKPGVAVAPGLRVKLVVGDGSRT
jgi:beta-lactam-binding protein with PASTA domain